MNDVVVNGARPFQALLGRAEGDGLVIQLSPIAGKSGAIEGGEGVLPADQAIGPANSAQAMLARYATPIDLSTTKNDDLVLEQYGRTSFDRLENRIRQQPKLLTQLAFASRGGTQRGIAAVFEGNAGHGKALAARVMAVRLDKPLYRLDMDKVLGDTAAQTLRNISAAIGLAASVDGILLIENLDALLADHSRDRVERDARVLTAGIAQKLRSQSGIILITAQNTNVLGQEFLDALTEKIGFQYPNVAERLEIWKRAFPADVPKTELPYNSMAQHQLNGSQISRAAMRAAAAACAEQKPVNAEHVKAAVMEEYRLAGRCTTQHEFNY